MGRLATTVSAAADLSVTDLVTHAVHALRSDDAEDDIAVLALRRTPAESDALSVGRLS